MENMLLDCSLGVNAIRQINDTKGMASFSLAKIADYLDCSVDYLLGRTDNPEINKTPDSDYSDVIPIAARSGVSAVVKPSHSKEERNVALDEELPGVSTPITPPEF